MARRMNQMDMKIRWLRSLLCVSCLVCIAAFQNPSAATAQASDLVATPDGAWSGEAPDPATSYAPFRVYNIGNNESVELLRFIQVLEDALGVKAELNMLPMQPGDVPATAADIDALARDTGFRPYMSIEEGLARFVEWYREFHGV